MSKKEIVVWVAKDDRPSCPSMNKVHVYAKAKPVGYYSYTETPKATRYGNGKEYPNHALTLPKGKARLLGLKPGECRKAKLVIS